jgi:hypothetical protein
MQPEAAHRLTTKLLSMSFDPGLRVTSTKVVGLPDEPLLLVHYEDERRPGEGFGAWWDFDHYTEYVHKAEEVDWLASHAKVHLEEIFWAGPPLEVRPRDEAGLRWCRMDDLEPARPPQRPS